MQKSLKYPRKKPDVCTKEPCLSATTLIFTVLFAKVFSWFCLQKTVGKLVFFHVKELNASAKEPYTSAKEPCVSAKEP